MRYTAVLFLYFDILIFVNYYIIFAIFPSGYDSSCIQLFFSPIAFKKGMATLANRSRTSS
jgi:hypothetical protein